MDIKKFQGVIPAFYACYDEKGEISPERVRKLARYLLANGQGGSVTCTASGLAQRLGISRASLYRAFEALEKSALIVRRGKTILIPDLAALESVL